MMKIALVHDYLTQPGGAERVFELLCRQFSHADVFTSIYDPQHSIALPDRAVHTTVLQNLPGASQYFRLLAPFYYPAFRALDLTEYDLIISSTTSFAKAVRKRSDATHICFCHNVTRFLWDTKAYLKQYTGYRFFSPLLEQVFEKLRKLDFIYAQEPDLYIANSSIVAQRIRQTYGKPAHVIHYPIDTQQFAFSAQKDDFYLACARLLGYKRMDIIVEAFNWLGWPLKITGDGPERKVLEARALGNIQFLGHVSDQERKQLLSKSRSVVVAALEDYGLVPIEANVSGTPVIAYGAGGVLDTQIPGTTGLLFGRQTPESLCSALLESRKISWNHHQIYKHARHLFSQKEFFEQVNRIIKNLF